MRENGKGLSEYVVTFVWLMFWDLSWRATSPAQRNWTTEDIDFELTVPVWPTQIRTEIFMPTTCLPVGFVSVRISTIGSGQWFKIGYRQHLGFLGKTTWPRYILKSEHWLDATR